jgi:hypothetical protein
VGEGRVHLRLAADQPSALVAVRLNNVHPDGTVERLSFGFLNLAHRHSHAKPAALKPGEFYDVDVKLKGVAQSVPAGNRLRIAVSTCYWPMVWPSPQAATLTVDPAASFVELPVLESEKGFNTVEFAPVEYATPLKMTTRVSGDESREAIHRIDDSTTRFVVTRDDGSVVIDDIGTEVSYTKKKSFSVGRDDPLASVAELECSAHYRRGAWDARLETETRLSCDKTHFYLSGKVRAFDKGKKIAERIFEHTVKRDYI